MQRRPRRHPLEQHAGAMSRRTLLGLLGGAGAAAALGACGSAEPPTASAGTTARRAPILGAEGTAPAAGVVPHDPNRPYWLQGNFAPVADEIHLTDLRVEGTLPADLDGLFLRNGSNPA